MAVEEGLCKGCSSSSIAQCMQLRTSQAQAQLLEAIARVVNCKSRDSSRTLFAFTMSVIA
jgi:hypothetical protein